MKENQQKQQTQQPNSSDRQLTHQSTSLQTRNESKEHQIPQPQNQANFGQSNSQKQSTLLMPYSSKLNKSSINQQDQNSKKSQKSANNCVDGSEGKKKQNPIITLYQVGFYSHRPTVSHDLTNIIKQLDFSEQQNTTRGLQVPNSQSLQQSVDENLRKSIQDENSKGTSFQVSQLKIQDNKSATSFQKRLFYQSYNESIFKDVKTLSIQNSHQNLKEQQPNRLPSMVHFFNRDEQLKQQDIDILRIPQNTSNQARSFQRELQQTPSKLANSKYSKTPNQISTHRMFAQSKTPIASQMQKQASNPTSDHLNSSIHKTPNTLQLKQSQLSFQKHEVFSEEYYNQSIPAKQVSLNGMIINNNLNKFAQQQQTQESKAVQSPLIIQTSKLGIQNDRKRSADFIVDSIKLLQTTSAQCQKSSQQKIQTKSEDQLILKPSEDSKSDILQKDQFLLFSPQKFSNEVSQGDYLMLNQQDANQAFNCRVLLIKKGKKLGRTVLRWAQLTKLGQLIYYSQPLSQEPTGIYSLYELEVERSQILQTLEIQKGIQSLNGGQNMLIEPFTLNKSSKASSIRPRASVQPLNLNQMIECFLFKRKNTDIPLFSIILNDKDQIFFRQPAIEVFELIFKLSTLGKLQDVLSLQRESHTLNLSSNLTHPSSSHPSQIYQQSQIIEIQAQNTLLTMNSHQTQNEQQVFLSPGQKSSQNELVEVLDQNHQQFKQKSQKAKQMHNNYILIEEDKQADRYLDFSRSDQKTNTPPEQKRVPITTQNKQATQIDKGNSQENKALKNSAKQISLGISSNLDNSSGALFLKNLTPSNLFHQSNLTPEHKHLPNILSIKSSKDRVLHKFYQHPNQIRKCLIQVNTTAKTTSNKLEQKKLVSSTHRGKAHSSQELNSFLKVDGYRAYYNGLKNKIFQVEEECENSRELSECGSQQEREEEEEEILSERGDDPENLEGTQLINLNQINSIQRLKKGVVKARSSEGANYPQQISMKARTIETDDGKAQKIRPVGTMQYKRLSTISLTQIDLENQSLISGLHAGATVQDKLKTQQQQFKTMNIGDIDDLNDIKDDEMENFIVSSHPKGVKKEERIFNYDDDFENQTILMENNPLDTFSRNFCDQESIILQQLDETLPKIDINLNSNDTTIIQNIQSGRIQDRKVYLRDESPDNELEMLLDERLPSTAAKKFYAHYDKHQCHRFEQHQLHSNQLSRHLVSDYQSRPHSLYHSSNSSSKSQDPNLFANQIMNIKGEKNQENLNLLSYQHSKKNSQVNSRPASSQLHESYQTSKSHQYKRLATGYNMDSNLNSIKHDFTQLSIDAKVRVLQQNRYQNYYNEDEDDEYNIFAGGSAQHKNVNQLQHDLQIKPITLELNQKITEFVGQNHGDSGELNNYSVQSRSNSQVKVNFKAAQSSIQTQDNFNLQDVVSQLSQAGALYLGIELSWNMKLNEAKQIFKYYESLSQERVAPVRADLRHKLHRIELKIIEVLITGKKSLIDISLRKISRFEEALQSAKTAMQNTKVQPLNQEEEKADYRLTKEDNMHGENRCRFLRTDNLNSSFSLELLELITAETLMFKGVLRFLLGQKFKAFMIFRDCWKIYKKYEQILISKLFKKMGKTINLDHQNPNDDHDELSNSQEQALLTATKQNPKYAYFDADFRSRLYLGLGLFYLGISVLPKSLTTLIRFAGVTSGNRDRGKVYFDKCIKERRCRTPYAALILSLFHLDSEPRLEKVGSTLKVQLRAFPHSALFLWVQSIVSWKTAQLDDAVSSIQKALSFCPQELATQAAFLKYEVGWFHYLKLEFDISLYRFKEVLRDCLNLDLDQDENGILENRISEDDLNYSSVNLSSSVKPIKLQQSKIMSMSYQQLIEGTEGNKRTNAQLQQDILRKFQMNANQVTSETNSPSKDSSSPSSKTKGKNGEKQAKHAQRREDFVYLPHRACLTMQLAGVYVALKRDDLVKHWLQTTHALANQPGITRSKLDQEMGHLATIHLNHRKSNALLTYEIIYFLHQMPKLPNSVLLKIISNVSAILKSLQLSLNCADPEIDYKSSPYFADYASGMMLTIICYCFLGDTDIALLFSQRLIKAVPHLPAIYTFLQVHSYYWAGRCCLAEGDKKQAEYLLLKAKKIKKYEFSIENKLERVLIDARK